MRRKPSVPEPPAVLQHRASDQVVRGERTATCWAQPTTGAALERLTQSVDPASADLIWHLWRHGHAPLDELAELMGAASDMMVLAKIHGIINAAAQRMWGRPLVVFQHCRPDPVSGLPVFGHWWLSDAVRGHASSRGLEAAEVDVFDEEQQVRVVVQLPAVAHDAVTVTAQPDLLVLSGHGDVGLRRTVPLPAPVDPGTLVRSCKNGILTLTLRKL